MYLGSYVRFIGSGTLIGGGRRLSELEGSECDLLRRAEVHCCTSGVQVFLDKEWP